MNLSKTLSFLFFLIAVLPVIAVGYLSYNSGRRTIELQTINHLVATNNHKQSELDAWLENKIRFVQTLAETNFFETKLSRMMANHNPDNPAHVAEEYNMIEGYLKPFLDGGDFLELFIMNAKDGEVVLSTSSDQVGKIKAFQPYFRKGREKNFVQTVYYSMSLRQPAIAISTPVKDQEGEPFAVLAAHVDLAALSRIIGQWSHGISYEDTYLVNTSNFFITEPRFGQRYALRKTVNTEGTRKALAKSNGVGLYDDYRGVPVIGAYKWIPEWKLVMITEIDQMKAYAPVIRLRRVTMILGIIIALAASLIGLLLARTISRPLNRLAKNALEIGKGDLEIQIEASGRGEIGKLARSFEQMRVALNETLVSRNDLTLEVARRKEAMDALEREKGFSDKVINSMPGVFYLLDEDLRFRRWNENFVTITGYSDKEMEAMTILDLFDVDDRGRMAKLIIEVFDKGSSSGEAFFVTQKGKKIPFYLTGERFQTGRETLLTGMGVDISARVRAEEALLLDRQRLLTILDGIDDPIYVADPETYELLHVNEVLKKTWSENIIGTKCYQAIHGLEEPCPFCTNDRIFGENIGESYIWEYRDEITGKWRRCSNKAIQWIDSRLVRFELASDITPIKNTQTALQERVRELQCLYAVSNSIRKSRVRDSIDDLFRDIVGLISSGWHASEIASARIRFEDREYVTEDFVETEWRLSSDIIVESKQRGLVEVFFTETRMKLKADGFLQEERDLIDAIASLLGEAFEKRESETRFTQLIERAPIPMCFINAKGELAYFNQRFSETFGYTHLDIPTLDEWWRLAYPDEEYRRWVLDTWNAAVENAALNQVDIKPIEYRVTCKNGRERIIEISGVTIGDSLLATFFDLTERRRIEDALREEELKVSTLLDNTVDFVSVVDPDGRFRYVNRSATKILGLNVPDAIGRSAFDFIHPDDRSSTMESFAGWLRDHATNASWENRQISVKGEVHHMLWTIMPRYVNGSLESIWSIARDITEQKRAEVALKELNENLSRSNKELEQFAYVASHDLQEPLRMVASYTQLLAQRYEGRLDQKADKYIGYAVDGAKRMQELINDLLAYSRVGTRGVPLNPVDCNEVVADVMKSLEKTIRENEAEVVVEELPKVMADSTQLGQVFQNLISNAVKFHGDRTPKIELTAWREGDNWEICVADNGIGIDPQFHERIFIIFQRLHERGRYSGSGIGLAIVKKIVERHGGTIRIESSAGKGTRFIFTIPAADNKGEVAQ